MFIFLDYSLYIIHVIKKLLFSRDGSHFDAHVLNINELKRMADRLRNDKNIAIYIHGYLDNVTTEDVQFVTRGMLRFEISRDCRR